MADLSAEQRDALAWEVTYGCGCYVGRGLCPSCRINFDRMVPLFASWIAAEREAAATAAYKRGWSDSFSRRGFDTLASRLAAYLDSLRKDSNA